MEVQYHFFLKTWGALEYITLTLSDQTHGAQESMGELGKIRIGHKRLARVLRFTQRRADQRP